ncbi:hypothetical protein [Falsiphaeobacter marinintestinus]|uniref:hypothetical protein n=1 Tax=Falsiphaeobacter marinintestinus TaxID=1492905 RepID=UPI0011B4B713|nr:hypothetical protein [Phaeobacter marinintestinus]
MRNSSSRLSFAAHIETKFDLSNLTRRKFLVLAGATSVIGAVEGIAGGAEAKKTSANITAIRGQKFRPSKQKSRGYAATGPSYIRSTLLKLGEIDFQKSTRGPSISAAGPIKPDVGLIIGPNGEYVKPDLQKLHHEIFFQAPLTLAEYIVKSMTPYGWAIDVGIDALKDASKPSVANPHIIDDNGYITDGWKKIPVSGMARKFDDETASLTQRHRNELENNKNRIKNEEKRIADGTSGRGETEKPRRNKAEVKENLEPSAQEAPITEETDIRQDEVEVCPATQFECF